MIAAVYARRSTDQNLPDAEKSVARQVEHSTAYATRKGWTVDAATRRCDPRTVERRLRARLAAFHGLLTGNVEECAAGTPPAPAGAPPLHAPAGRRLRITGHVACGGLFTALVDDGPQGVVPPGSIEHPAQGLGNRLSPFCPVSTHLAPSHSIARIPATGAGSAWWARRDALRPIETVRDARVTPGVAPDRQLTTPPAQRGWPPPVSLPLAPPSGQAIAQRERHRKEAVHLSRPPTPPVPHFIHEREQGTHHHQER